MMEAIMSLRQEFSLLFWSSVYTAILLVPSLALLIFDSRVVVGANPWVKPVKFELSILIFNLTIGWLLQRMVMPVLSARVIGWVVAVAIVLNTVALGWLCVISFGPQSQLPPAVVWGIRLGLILFLFSSFQGFQIVGHKGHTVGASDGGPGLPFLRWSTVAGDLRIAHFIGIHGIQMLPLLGFFVSRTERQAGSGVVASAFAAIAALFFWALAQAWAGRPLLR